MISLVCFLCFNSSLGKLLFILWELCWRASEIALLFALFDVPCSPTHGLWPVVIVGVSGFSYHWWNWHIVKSYWRALISVPAKIGEQWSCQLHTHPGNVFFSRNMERPLVGKGGGRQTNCHFRGGKIFPFVLLSSSTSNFTDLRLPGYRRGKKERRKSLIWVLAATYEWR